jgi:hypothetical protein
VVVAVRVIAPVLVIAIVNRNDIVGVLDAVDDIAGVMRASCSFLPDAFAAPTA